ncbi:sensor histidine kinase [Actinomarinicola tropica]|uniref:histidine kinase n=1 Tax=Actinomarinicola tropica TaxID=2789776 RepID=A0A5Q2RCD0_9ACTN|nr:sensor histidine kinase [Actinomarinicola tropica]QGG94549.1 ATPase [Actinomarinicola tropica]
MASIAEISRERTALPQEAIDHLQRLVTAWGLLADFCFADLLLFAVADRVPGSPSDGGDGADGGPATDAASPFVVLGHIRPTTSQTLYRDDLVGQIIQAAERPLVARAFQHGEIIEGEITVAAIHERVRVQCIPVRCNGEVVGIMTRESAPLVGRQPGELERTYVEIFHRLARMIAHGDYPYAGEDADAEEPPRVGDGVILLDRSARVVFSSPNAISALHRIGIHGNTEGMKLTDYGFDDRIIKPAYQSRVPVTREIERGIDTTVVFRCLPLLDATDVSGAVLICRDISDLRRRDRLLLSKDATIREIHHRVKNNLQTIGSLLRLQGRRLAIPEARSAIEESVRRIRSIAIVHESLSRNAEDDVPFGDILRPIVRMAEESMVSPECPVYFRVDGEAGRLPATVATPLAVVLNELLQNAVDHAYPAESQLPGGHVKIAISRDDQRLCVEVADDGIGMPDTFDLGAESGLGLTIVRTLVETELGGAIAMRAHRPGTARPGTVIELTVQLDAPWLSGDDETVRRPTGQMPAVRVGSPPPTT